LDKDLPMQKIFVSLFSVSLIFFSCNSTEDKTSENPNSPLAFHPEKGLKKEMGYEFSVESPSQNAALQYKMEVSLEVVETTDKETDLKITFNSLSMTGNADTLKIDVTAGTYDSLQPEGMLYAEPYFVSLNHSFLTKYDRKMTRISEELLTERDSLSLIAPTNRAQFFTALPDSIVKPGDKWTNLVEIKSGKGMTVKATYVLKKIEKNIAYIDFTGDLDGSGENFGHDFSMKGKVYGFLEVDAKSGLTLKSEMIQDLILVLSGNETPMKFTIKQYIK
jgi:hypothetical protein